jgi:hypothetical protein
MESSSRLNLACGAAACQAFHDNVKVWLDRGRFDRGALCEGEEEKENEDDIRKKIPKAQAIQT